MDYWGGGGGGRGKGHVGTPSQIIGEPGPPPLPTPMIQGMIIQFRLQKYKKFVTVVGISTFMSSKNSIIG